MQLDGRAARGLSMSDRCVRARMRPLPTVTDRYVRCTRNRRNAHTWPLLSSGWSTRAGPFQGIKKACQCPVTNCQNAPFDDDDPFCDDCGACRANQGNHGCKCQSPNCDGQFCDGVYNDGASNETVLETNMPSWYTNCRRSTTCADQSCTPLRVSSSACHPSRVAATSCGSHIRRPSSALQIRAWSRNARRLLTLSRHNGL